MELKISCTFTDKTHLNCNAQESVWNRKGQGARLCSNGARSPEATNIWPRATVQSWAR